MLNKILKKKKKKKERKRKDPLNPLHVKDKMRLT